MGSKAPSSPTAPCTFLQTLVRFQQSSFPSFCNPLPADSQPPGALPSTPVLTETSLLQKQPSLALYMCMCSCVFVCDYKCVCTLVCL